MKGSITQAGSGVRGGTQVKGATTSAEPDASARASASHLKWVCLGSTWARLRGLLGRPVPAAHEIWCLPGSWGVHTWGMSYPIDIVFLGANGQILRCDQAVPPRRVCAHGRAALVWEMAPGSVVKHGWQPGQILQAAPCFKLPTSGVRPACCRSFLGLFW